MAGAMLCNLKLIVSKRTAFSVKERSPEVDSTAEPMTKNSKVPILGGNDRVGGSTAIAFSNLRLDLSLFVAGRNLEKGDALTSKIGNQSKFVRVYIDDMESLGAALDDVDLVVHTARPFQRVEKCIVLEATKLDIPFLPVFASMKRLLRYNLGSVALGSLVLSFTESIRFILEPIRRRLKVTYISPDEGWAGKIAITGKGFFKSSAMATMLIMNNILRIGKVNVVGDVILSLGKLCVNLSSALFALLMLDTHKYKSSHNKISSPLFPLLVCWGLGYVVATLFFGVVEMSIDTIILSYCQDSEEHQGTAQYAPPPLIETPNDNDAQRHAH